MWLNEQKDKAKSIIRYIKYTDLFITLGVLKNCQSKPGQFTSYLGKLDYF